MKKIISFLLVLVMLSASLIGCAKEEEVVVTTEADDTLTLSMYLMAEKEVSPEVEKQIEDAVNSITKSKYRIQLDLRYYTEEEYYQALDAAFLQADEEAASGSIFDDIWDEEEEEESESEEETVLNELGLPELKYPEITDYQVDIFYLSGIDNYNYFDLGGYLQDVSNATGGLTADIFPMFLTYMKTLTGGTYAIPTNKAIGQYNFLLLNREAMVDTNYSKGDFTSVVDANCQDFIQLVAESYRDEYVPFYTDGNVIDSVPNYKYWGVDENGKLCENFSILGARFDQSVAYKSNTSAMNGANLLGNTAFVEHVTTLRGYEFSGYCATEEEKKSDKDFAVGYVTGGAEIYSQYGDKYDVIPLSAPIFTTDDIFGDMFALGIYNSDISRTMNIINLMNTNVEFKNLLLYGIEGTHYEFVESDELDENGDPYKLVRRKTDDNGEPLYLMANEKTGNTFNAYTLEGQDPKWTEYAKIQNREAIVSLALGFSANYDGYEVNTQELKDIAALSKKIYDGIMACETADELDKYIKKQKTAIDNNASFKAVITDKDPTGQNGDEPTTFAELYRKWLSDIGVFKYEEK